MYWALRWQRHSETTAISILCSKQAANFFFPMLHAVKRFFYFLSVRPCMHHNLGVISGRHACRDCVWRIFLGAGLYTTCRGERVSVVIRFNVTFLYLTPYWGKMHTSFLNDAESLTKHDYVFIVWTLQPHVTLWLSTRELQCLFEGVCIPQYFRTLPGFYRVGHSALFWK